MIETWIRVLQLSCARCHCALTAKTIRFRFRRPKRIDVIETMKRTNPSAKLLAHLAGGAWFCNSCYQDILQAHSIFETQGRFPAWFEQEWNKGYPERNYENVLNGEFFDPGRHSPLADTKYSSGEYEQRECSPGTVKIIRPKT